MDKDSKETLNKKEEQDYCSLQNEDDAQVQLGLDSCGD